jgi:type II secretory pathway component PulM
MKQIEAYVLFWEGALKRSREHLAYLQQLKSTNAVVIDQDGMKILDDRIYQEDYAVGQFQKGLTRAKVQLSLAKQGEDV